MADGYVGKKNYVLSRTSKAASAKSIVSEDVTVFAERLRSEGDKDIWLVGGADLVAAFPDSGQVDEFIIHDPKNDWRWHSLGRTTLSRPQFETTSEQEVP
jgi:dihydrofolate reductase